MPILKVIVLAIIQGLAELLPVSSSAHVVVAEKFMGLDPSLPQMTMLLVMLHTGTMFAVITVFWKSWKETYFSSAGAFKHFAARLILATILTAIVGNAIKRVLEATLFRGAPKTGIEQLFSHLELIAPAFAAAGVLILLAGFLERRTPRPGDGAPSSVQSQTVECEVGLGQAAWMGIVQGIALPFRGFSRSGSTISTGMLTGATKTGAERFSFAMAVVLTPPVVAIELVRLLAVSRAKGAPIDLHAALWSSLLGMVFSFFAGLAALKWLSSWLENGRWYVFGIYCVLASVAVYWLHLRGF